MFYPHSPVITLFCSSSLVQIFKDGVRRSVMEGKDEEARYFDKEELKNLFKLGERGRCRVLEEHIPGTQFDNR